MPKYSIIIPVYKAEKTIQKCIESILNQPYQDFELILVDDCSPDGSFEICEQYQSVDKRVKVLHQDLNKGVSAARNRGLDCAHGEFVIFVDSDDFVDENYLTTIDQYAGIYDLVEFGHFDYITDTNDQILEIKKSSLCCVADNQSEYGWYNFLMNSFFASPCNKVFNHDLMGNIHFDEECVCYEDYLFNLQYCRNVNTFVVIDTPLYYYRQIQKVNPISKRKWGKTFEISHKVAFETLSFAEMHEDLKMKKYICRYPYGAFLAELKAAKENLPNYSIIKKELLKDKYFFEVTRHIYPKGKLISLLVFSMNLKLYFFGGFILDKLIA